jgi:release factor glutamine methyltransferase
MTSKISAGHVPLHHQGVSTKNASPAHIAVANVLRASGCVFADEEAALLVSEAKTPEELEEMVNKRASGRPLEYILGWAEFLGSKYAVGPGVFVPRRRSEFLARRAISLVRPGDVVADIGCGSGALGAAVAASIPNITLYATDIDPTEVEYARRNLSGMRAGVFLGDLFDPLPAALHGRLSLVIANMPYVPTGAVRVLPAEARLHEHAVALDGGPDGLDLHRRLAAAAPTWLAPGGYVLVESSRTQSPTTAAIFTANGLQSRIATSDVLEATIVVGRMPNK